jgi:hypothetical protein
MGLHSTVDLGRIRRRCSWFAVEGWRLSFRDEPLADAIDCVHVHVQLLGDLIAHEPTAWTVAIAQEEYVGMPDLLGRCVAISGDVC